MNIHTASPGQVITVATSNRQPAEDAFHRHVWLEIDWQYVPYAFTYEALATAAVRAKKNENDVPILVTDDTAKNWLIVGLSAIVIIQFIALMLTA
jgi:hypothetical protein